MTCHRELPSSLWEGRIATTDCQEERQQEFSPSERTVTRKYVWRPRQDSNLRTRLRRPMLYPLSYEGSLERKLHASGTSAILGLK